MACPICTSPEGSAISEGMRAGAGMLMVVTTIVVGVIVRFGYRLWIEESAGGTDGISAVTHD